MNHENFIIDNQAWLKLWLENTKTSKAKRFQVFRRSREISYDADSIWLPLRHLGAKGATKKVTEELVVSLEPDYTLMTLTYLVFGKRSSIVHDIGICYTLSGFVEQTGRLPTSKDKVVLWECHKEPQPIVSENGSSLYVKFQRAFSRLQILSFSPEQ